MDDNSASPIEKMNAKISRTFQHLLDKSSIHFTGRWLAFVGLLGLYVLRVFFLNGFFLVTYGLGIYLLNNLIGFLSPQVDPFSEGPILPDSSSDEFRPFERKLPEFQFWYACFRGVFTALCLTAFPMFDVPVFWPILLIYFLTLFCLTMRRQIKHMIKYRYVPIRLGKQRPGQGKGKGKGKKGDDDLGGGGGGPDGNNGNGVVGGGATGGYVQTGTSGLTQPKPVKAKSNY